MAAKKKLGSINKEMPDLAKDAVDRLKDLFPEAVTEGNVDFEKLRAAPGDVVDDRPERYSLYRKPRERTGGTACAMMN